MRNQQAFDAIGRKVGEQFPTRPVLVLDTQLRIRAVTSAYAGATLRESDELVEQFMFDAFPDDPSDPQATGTANLAASLETAMRTGRKHDMWIQRYDIPDPAVADGFLPKVWSPTNSPIIDHGELLGVFHQVEEVADVGGALSLMARAIDAGDTCPVAELLHALTAVNTAENTRRGKREQALVAETEQLRRAIDTRDTIGQAKGIVMERFGIDAVAAFQLLKRLSQETNTPLRDIARKLIDADHLPPPSSA
ncbi:ANTAR domain-containing protein [Mycobacterium sp. C3-094]